MNESTADKSGFAPGHVNTIAQFDGMADETPTVCSGVVMKWQYATSSGHGSNLRAPSTLCPASEEDEPYHEVMFSKQEIDGTAEAAPYSRDMIKCFED